MIINRFFQQIAYLTVLMALSLMLILSYWYIYPYKVVEYKNVPFPVLNENSVVARGDRLRYLVNYCKYTDDTAILTKFFVDGVIFETPKVPSIIENGCGEVIVDVYVPRAIPAGVYSLKIVAIYNVNPIRTIKFTSYTENFTVK